MDPKKVDKVARAIIYGMVALICLILAAIIVFVLWNGVPQLNRHFLTAPPQEVVAGGGIGPEIFNSFYILFLTLVISTPIALGSAIYLSEYAGDHWFKRLILLAIEVLSSLPSIVVGLFGFLLFVIKFQWQFSLISGAFTLMIFNLPILVRVMEQGLNQVDDSQREAALALGLTRWECARHVLLPAALPTIMTGFILTSGRIFGEAAALIYTSGQTTTALQFASLDFSSPSNAWNVMRPAETLAVHLWKINSEGIVPDAAAISNGTAAVLIISILVFNLLARLWGRHLYHKQTAN